MAQGQSLKCCLHEVLRHFALCMHKINIYPGTVVLYNQRYWIYLFEYTAQWVADPGFPPVCEPSRVGGCGHTIFPNSPKNCMNL